jgi:hypothetical protein
VPNAPIGPSELWGKRGSSVAGTSFDLRILGLGGVPDVPDDVLAVVMNITVAEASVTGNLAAYSADLASPPAASNVNFRPGRSVANQALVRPSTADCALPVEQQVDCGRITVTLRSGSVGDAHVIIDVVGYLTTSSAAERGGRMVSISPIRLRDTRLPQGSPDPIEAGTFQTIGVKGATPLSPAGAPAIPDDPGISAVIVNVTLINTLPGAAGTYLAALPENPVGEPSTSTVNAPAGIVRANLAIVPLGADGDIRIYNRNGSVHVVVDAVGYIQADPSTTSRTGRIVPLETPFRSFDTRLPEFGVLPLGPGLAEDWDYSDFVSSLTYPSNGQSVGAISGLLGNLTGVGLTRLYPAGPEQPSFITLLPGDVPLTGQPATSTLNIRENEAVPNMAVVRLPLAGSADQYVMTAYNDKGYVHYMFDVAAVVLQ